MVMNAYSKLYLEDAMNSLAIMLDYGALADGDAGRFFDRFIVSDVSRQFEKGNPRYIAGLSGIELAELVLQSTGASQYGIQYFPSGRTKEYWSGWVLAYTQWYTGKSFENLADCGINIAVLNNLYPTLHEADLSKVISVIINFMERSQSDTSPLKKQRKLAGLTQKELADATGVKIRMIQAYEQNYQDISKAEFATVIKLSRCLGCLPEDLLG